MTATAIPFQGQQHADLEWALGKAREAGYVHANIAFSGWTVSDAARNRYIIEQAPGSPFILMEDGTFQAVRR